MQNRREFLKKAALFSGALGISSVIPASIQKALAINPEKGSTYLDAEHIVFLMQENRSFDHCFGTLKGVRGFNDPRALKMRNQLPVWLQSNKKGETYAPFRLNIKDTKATWMSSLPHGWSDQTAARNNGWHDNWLEAKKSGNPEYKDMPLTMGYYNREDIPFYYALADAFTVCDQHFCSSITGTSSNRLHFWTGKLREKQERGSEPRLNNGQIDGAERLSWKTFPERLQENGISWKIYQNELSVNVGFKGEEDDWLANFTDNTIEFFEQYKVKQHPAHISYLKKIKKELTTSVQDKSADAKAKERLAEVSAELDLLESRVFDKKMQELHQNAFVTNINDPDYHQLDSLSYTEKGEKRSTKLPKGDVLHQFRKDVDSGKLPEVSWLVAPANFSDHPGAPWYGAWYLSEVMNILTKNPEVWKKTIFVLTYDENDGYFDHVPPFVAPNPDDKKSGATSDSIFSPEEYVSEAENEVTGPVGLGYRVPLVIASPWSRGGYVNSQVFDHTSNLQFLEHFFRHKKGLDLRESNISKWRRSLCGNLTSVFKPYNGEKTRFPKTLDRNRFIESIDKAQYQKLPDNFNAFTAVELDKMRTGDLSSPKLPQQEKGIKPACALPHEIYVDGTLNRANNSFAIHFASGDAFFGENSPALAFNVHSSLANRSFTVVPGEPLSAAWSLNDFENGRYDLQLHGVNGFYRAFTGNAKDPEIQVELLYGKQNGQADGNLNLRIVRTNPKAERLVIMVRDNAYGSPLKKITLANGKKELSVPIDLKSSHGWYDLTLTVDGYGSFSQQFAGHVETGQDSFTDPLMGREV